MFTYKNIKELENIINYLNTTDEPRIDEMSNMTENIQSFLNIIASIKPNKAKNAKKLFFNSMNKKQKQISHKYTRDEAVEIISSNLTDSILQKYSLDELKAMYLAVYENKPLSKSTKKDIVFSLEQMLRQIKRTEGFKKIGL